MTRLVVATRNPGKLAELNRALDGLDLELLDLGRFPGLPVPPEEGETFAENARAKAVAAARGTGLPALADDSGLVVPALGGRPGVRSARFAGPEATDEENRARLLAELEKETDRGAWFACHLCLAGPDGAVLWEGQGSCHGAIAPSPRGRGGFGYDPVFLYPPAQRTFGELPPEDKARVSHRGAALRALRRALGRGIPGLRAAGGGDHG